MEKQHYAFGIGNQQGDVAAVDIVEQCFEFALKTGQTGSEAGPATSVLLRASESAANIVVGCRRPNPGFRRQPDW
jgi:hypothetical protein